MRVIPWEAWYGLIEHYGEEEVYNLVKSTWTPEYADLFYMSDGSLQVCNSDNVVERCNRFMDSRYPAWTKEQLKCIISNLCPDIPVSGDNDDLDIYFNTVLKLVLTSKG